MGDSDVYVCVCMHAMRVHVNVDGGAGVRVELVSISEPVCLLCAWGRGAYVWLVTLGLHVSKRPPLPPT